MALTNNLVPQVDLPVWEWTRFAPNATTSLTALCTAKDGSSRFLYYFFGSQLLRYDTLGDSWQTLSTGVATPVTALDAQYVKNQGYRGNVLSATTNTLQIPSIGTDITGYQIKIISGTGEGQVRTISSVGPEITHDSGVVTTATANALTDTTKRWKQNQWVGYGVRLVFNTGFSQFREVVYNDITSVTVFDAQYEGRNFSMAPFISNTPYGTPVATAGSQANFNIVSQVITVDSPWDVTPDSTSRFMIMSDAIWLLSSNSVSPFFTFYYYDILSDRWVQKVTPTGIFPAALGTDFTMMPLTDYFGGYPIVGSATTSTVTSATTRTITDTNLSLTPGSLIGSKLAILSGTGINQERRIISNTSQTIVVSSNFDTTPVSGSTYMVTGEDTIYVAGNGRAEMHKYFPEASVWAKGNLVDWGFTKPLGLDKPNNNRFGFNLFSADRATNGITSVASTPTAGGSGYSVGDLLTVSTGGSLGRVYVERVSTTGAVLEVSLYTCGNGYSVGTGRATTGGTGAGCTINILSVGTIAVFTSIVIPDIKFGDTVNFLGAVDPNWNQSYTILGIQSTLIFEAEAFTAILSSASVLTALGTNLLVDVTKNWIPNEHAGKILGIQQSGLSGAVSFRRIIGNSQTSISYISGVQADTTSRYFITDLEAFGDDETYLADNQLSYGFATSGTTGVLVDTNKNWLTNAFSGVKVNLIDISGNTLEEIISTNTPNTLNVGRTVALGQGTNTITYSNDNGVNWIGLGTTVFSTLGNGVVWSGTRFVAVGQGTNSVAYSNDGITWVPTASGAGNFSTAGNGICWNGTRFVAVGEGTNSVMFSPDGITWTVIALGASTFTTRGNAIAFNGSLHVAMGEGTNTIATGIASGSTMTWTGRGSTIFTTSGRAVVWGGTRWVAGGSGTNTVATSTDGITWTAGTTPTNFTSVNGLAWNGTRFVAVGTVSSGTNCIAHSTDGSTWTVPVTGILSQGNAVSWNGTHFVAAGVSSTNSIAISTDGITWTAATTASLFSTSGRGVGSTSPFVSLTPNIGIVIDSNVRYKIQDSAGSAQGTQSTTTLQDLSKRWKVNQWAGKRLVMTSGTGIQQELAIASNTSNTLTFGTATAPDVSTTYTIIGKPAVGAGIQLFWNYGTSVTEDKGRLIFLPRGGGSHTFDIYDIRTNRWKYGQFLNGAGDLLTTGTMYTYDGVDRIYYQVNATGRINYYDIAKNYIYPFSTVPYGMGAALLSNRMGIINTADNLQYMYVMRHSGTEMWRCLIYV